MPHPSKEENEKALNYIYDAEERLDTHFELNKDTIHEIDMDAARGIVADFEKNKTRAHAVRRIHQSQHL